MSNPSPFDQVVKATEELYNIRDSKILSSKCKSCLELLESLPSECQKMHPGTYEYLKGKIINSAGYNYNKEAENYLSKAIELDSCLVDAWVCLAGCLMKKKDLRSVKHYCERASIVVREMGVEKKEILEQLYLLQIKFAKGEDEYEMLENSIRYAKQAANMDVRDGKHWYNLGFACYTSFIQEGSWDHAKLAQSLEAFQLAMEDKRMECNHSLLFYYGMVNEHLYGFVEAHRGYQLAANNHYMELGSDQAVNIINLLNSLDSSLKILLEPEKLSLPKPSFTIDDRLTTKHTHEMKSVDSLSDEGYNEEVVVVCRIFECVKDKNIKRVFYVAYDSTFTKFVLCVHGIQDNVIRKNNEVAIVEPIYQMVKCSLEGKDYEFKIIEVNFSQQLIVNGKTLKADQFNLTKVES